MSAAGPIEALELPLLAPTPPGWAARAAAELDVFLADHATCEQAAALAGLNLAAHYPEDAELVERMSALAVEEATHLRRVARLLHRRGGRIAGRRPNPYTAALHARASRRGEPERKIDRLLVGALIEARSCERFTLLGERLRDAEPEVAALLAELGPAEARHWRMFHDLAARSAADPAAFERRWRGWLEFEAGLQADAGAGPTVHG